MKIEFENKPLQLTEEQFEEVDKIVMWALIGYGIQGNDTVIDFIDNINADKCGDLMNYLYINNIDV